MVALVASYETLVFGHPRNSGHFLQLSRTQSLRGFILVVLLRTEVRGLNRLSWTILSSCMVIGTIGIEVDCGESIFFLIID